MMFLLDWKFAARQQAIAPIPIDIAARRAYDRSYNSKRDKTEWSIA